MKKCIMSIMVIKSFRSGIIGAEVQEVKKEICFMEEGDVFDLGNRTLESSRHQDIHQVR